VCSSDLMISKIRNEFLNTILIKIPRNQGKLQLIKHTLQSLTDRTLDDKVFRSVKIVFDVDPM
jgi:primosomal protein N' (replication factor Y)